MRKLFHFFVLTGFFFMIPSLCIFGQVGINSNLSAPDPSAGLDVNFNNKGVLFPRLTQGQIEAIVNPANGLVVFCTTSNKFFTYLSDLNKWKEIAYGFSIINPGGGWYCGDPFTTSHIVVNGVAPVDKTVTYGTVTNIPGEPAKCWITGNLGSDHQANAVDDASEASAGWYWQFNRKQGYRHDGTARTPNTAWITSIGENFDWQAANDPCSLEFGNGWRIPTATEWTNVDAAGNWTNPNSAWNSALKMHAAGYLFDTGGSLDGRGTNGIYWSNMQSASGKSWGLYFFSSSCFISEYNKSYGFSIRCIR
ncbi:MAG: hypothetical protein NT040_19695 [Bacteroidetes bacterium]|nr:hypothetical protein [Bacteroidota bacterium]